MRTVTREEFQKFIKEYPRPLDVDVAHIFTPPVRTWNDFTLGDWPASIIASQSLEFDPKTGKDTPEKDEFKITGEPNAEKTQR